MNVKWATIVCSIEVTFGTSVVWVTKLLCFENCLLCWVYKDPVPSIRKKSSFDPAQAEICSFEAHV